MTTRYRSEPAWIDLDDREITLFFGICPGCQVSNNLYPARGVLNILDLTGGGTCNFAPASVPCVAAEDGSAGWDGVNPDLRRWVGVACQLDAGCLLVRSWWPATLFTFELIAQFGPLLYRGFRLSRTVSTPSR